MDASAQCAQAGIGTDETWILFWSWILWILLILWAWILDIVDIVTVMDFVVLDIVDVVPLTGLSLCHKQILLSRCLGNLGQIFQQFLFRPAWLSWGK